MKPEFQSDGCTGFPEIIFGIDLTDCCYAHDLAWWNSPGDLSVFLQSNVELAQCFTEVGAWWLAIPAFLAVTIIGFFLFTRKSRTS